MTRITSLIAAVLLSACSSTTTYNPTVFPYEIDEARLAQSKIKRVVIAHVNLGGPSRSYLQEAEPRLDRLVDEYLEKQKLTVLPKRIFEQRWKTAERIYGDPYDPTSGRINEKAFALILMNVRDELVKSDKVDAIIFTDLLEKEISFSGGLKHLARWDGVARKPTLQGPGDGVSGGFNWNAIATAASLRVSV